MFAIAYHSMHSAHDY